MVVGAAALAALALASCSMTPSPAPSSSTTRPATPSASASLAPTGPAFDADGTAADNLPLFTAVMTEVWASEARVQGRAYIDALVAAGFPRAGMEVTNDQTSVGTPADAIQFAVAWAGECLIGQVGPSTPEPTALVMPALPEGDCLIGVTRTIDW